MNLKPRPAMPSEVGNAPIRLEQDDQGRWVIMLNDGTSVLEAILPDETVDALAKRITSQPQEPNGVQAQVTVVEYANLGDSAAFIRKPLTFDPDETVGHLLDRAHNLGQPYRYHQAGERVELQVIQETIPEVKSAVGVTPNPWDDF